MSTFSVFFDPVFERKLAKKDTRFKQWVFRMVEQLKVEPFLGQPLGVRWFREKKFEKYRLYYLIFSDLEAIYFVHISEKKDQEVVIATIRQFGDDYRRELLQLIENKKKDII